ncbi:Bacterio-opsin activator HTH domain protein [Halorubrum aidingense JCM 13560]|uniref:Bacterio-opsin activator HTH domain protein n=1 Tax=Halorubrum aidingense JCM 13560 TaxID=1230454 RepID=M0PDU5_9EURY|nr:bacterio-opsin activator domain-containing protein [Halorubrum aidingense]EMA68312.1 Bacterio-opsin activator HTH domain protein [Halorubrum aidingense JCM 13560]
MVDGLHADAYDALVTAAETYRAAIVVRLAGEAGLRTAEITRVTPGDLRQSDAAADAFLLAVPADPDAGDENEDEDGSRGGRETVDRETVDRETIDRETVVPSSLAADLRRYAESAGIAPDDPFVDVSSRRVQMIVAETAERAATRTDGAVPDGVTPSDLRATFARRLLVDRGVSPHVVREAGGWQTLGSLDGYLGPLDGAAIAAAVAETDGDGSTTPSTETAPRSTVLTGFEAIADAGGGDGVGDAGSAGDVDRSGDADGVDGAADPEDDSPLTAVPNRLVATGRWGEAWVVRGRADGRRTEVLGAAGVDRVTLGDRDLSSGPWRDALVDGNPAASDGHPAVDGRPTVAVPVRHRDATHGVLCVVAADDTPVSDAERRALSALGRCLGWAVTAGRWRDLLHSDAVTEVEFRTAAAGAFLARASAALGCRIELSSTVSVDADASRFYLSVSGARPQAIADIVDDADGVSDLRVIETREDGCAVSVRVEGGSAVRALTEHGATVRDATATDGDVRVVADLPEGASVRPVAAGLRDRFPDARLVSKESIARSPLTESSLREGVADRFTDRQWAALSAAYHGGYFDWPRGSTAEEVADAMDVSSPTFHNHLRKAQRALLDGLFEDERRRDRP